MQPSASEDEHRFDQSGRTPPVPELASSPASRPPGPGPDHELHARQDERQRLPRPGLGLAHDVLAGEQQRRPAAPRDGPSPEMADPPSTTVNLPAGVVTGMNE